MNHISDILSELDGDTSRMFATQLSGWNHGGEEDQPD